MKKIILLLVVIFYSKNNIAQTDYVDLDVLESYMEYVEMEREVAYAHINKSVFVKGEAIGLQAYFFNKETKQLSTETSNAYFTISNDKGKVIKSKLVMANAGIAVSDFQIDSLFTSGNYNVKVFTNWMRNFNEQNFFTETIRILDPVLDNVNKDIVNKPEIDAQFLGESGHILIDVDNTIGVVLKNEYGIGVPFVKGEIVESNNATVATFKVNQFGIGKFIFKPELNKSYKAKYNYENKDYEVAISTIQNTGIVLNVKDASENLVLNFKTNSKTLPAISKYVYKLVIHNGSELKESFFSFKNKKDIRIELPKKDLYTGINIFTVFDKDNNPILERQYFNYDGLSFTNSLEPKVITSQDTTTVKIPYNAIDSEVLNQFSISVLPAKTKANSRHHNLASYTLLQPYVKGYIEEANYYFSNISNKKKYDLDNLLITQGWSSYDWKTIFEDAPEYDYDAEKGIAYTATSLTDSNARLMLYPILNSQMEFAKIDSENRSFIKSGLFPVNDEQIQIGEITATGQILKPKLKLSFNPSSVPEIDNIIKPGNVLVNVTDEKNISNNILAWKAVESLEEVFVEKKKEYTKIEKLQNRSLGKVEAIDEAKSTKYQTLVRYLREKGFAVNDSPGRFIITNNLVNDHRDKSVRLTNYTPVATGGQQAIQLDQHSSLRDNNNSRLAGRNGEYVDYAQNASSIPIVYFNGMMLHQNLEVLANLRMNQIEYIEINKTGAGTGMRGGAGAGLIRIKTKIPSEITKEIEKKEISTKYNIPLKFSVAKSFYIPNYVSKQNDFFNEFGTIGWYTNLTLDANGELIIKIPSKGLSSVKLFIEGVTNNSTFVSEIKNIKIN
ncbi:hypothetical protein [uncultured Lacinutrix sp.]|uniref:hypothetical protein n=1 Tax=uncultured Lacinutrix sp. TaxID=574032 RepID=UPI00260DB943|nr:hypothetical protein [uncultured Lacinutrix sp.]